MNNWDKVRQKVKPCLDIHNISNDQVDTLLPFSLRGISGEGKVIKVYSGDIMDVLVNIDVYSLLRPYMVGGDVETIRYNALSNNCTGNIVILLKCKLSNVTTGRKSTSLGKIAIAMLENFLNMSDNFIHFNIVGQQPYAHEIILTSNDVVYNDLVISYSHPKVGRIAWTENEINTKRRGSNSSKTPEGEDKV